MNRLLRETLKLALIGGTAGGVVTGYLAWRDWQAPEQSQVTQTAPHKTEADQIENPVAAKTPDLLSPFYSAPAIAAGEASSEQRIINLYKQVSSSVVNITTRSLTYNQFMEVVPRDGAGSGFVIDANGHVLTNYHVVQGAQKCFVTFGNREQSYPAQVIGLDKRSDLAVIRVQAPKQLLRPVQMGDSSRLQIGQTGIAIGNPFGLGQTITTGVISSLGRKIEVEEGRIMSDLIQTDASINRGNSGGPLFDSNGRVIGINSMIISPTGGSIGLGFAIPINTARRFIPDLIRYGRAQYPWLGISILPLTPRIAQILNLTTQAGLLVLQTYPGGAAQSAGLQGGTQKYYLGNYELYLGGDIILAVDGKPMRSETDLTNYLETQKRVGDQIKVTILRAGSRTPVTVPVRLNARVN